MAKHGIHVCSFSTGLDELTRKEQADDDVVLNILRLNKRFSAFEASATPTIARTMTRLCRTRLTTIDLGYPWTGIVKIDGEYIGEANAQPSPNPGNSLE